MNFQKELYELLNKWSMETESNTPDFILAQFLMDCLRNYERTVRSCRIFFSALNEPLPAPPARTPDTAETPIPETASECKYHELNRDAGWSYCHDCGERFLP